MIYNMRLDLGDLDDLEQEMNELSSKATAASRGNSSSDNTKSLGGMAASLFGLGGFMGSKQESAQPMQRDQSPTNEYTKTDANLGYATRESAGNTKTWDGFSKMNDVPASGPASSSSTNLNDREKRRKKRLMLKKMEEWYEKGQVRFEFGWVG